MSETEAVIRSAEDSGWEWKVDGRLVHPADDELTIACDPYTGDVVLSPKLVGLIAMENWQHPTN